MLVGAAARHLRSRFIEAGAGITGANALVAATGTVMLVCNEGNTRLASALPPVHIVIAGIDKLVPTLADATTMLESLPRSATGQPISTYVSFISGPSRSADIELSLSMGVHGPRHVHIVLLDNGREAIRANPRMRSALRCVRCGACSNVCPVYQQVGGHAMGHIYTGPIGLLVTPYHHGLEHVEGPQSLCAGCGACASVCPAGIPIHDLILDVRERAVSEGYSSSTMKQRALGALADERLLERGARLAAKAPGCRRWGGAARLAAKAAAAAEGPASAVPRPDWRTGDARVEVDDASCLLSGLPDGLAVAGDRRGRSGGLGGAGIRRRAGAIFVVLRAACDQRGVQGRGHADDAADDRSH